VHLLLLTAYSSLLTAYYFLLSINKSRQTNKIKMKKIVFGSLLLLFTASAVKAQNKAIGYWSKDAKGLPYFAYTGKIPYAATLQNGKKVKLPADPWFLLGNYQFKLFTHVSGEYEMITGQRAWGRMNQGALPNSGLNNASLTILNAQGKTIKYFPLTGMQSLAADTSVCKRSFGCGFASYSYNTDPVSVSRVLSVKPSANPYNGTSAFLLTVHIKNSSSKKIIISYNESVTANYEMIQQQRNAAADKKVTYINSLFTDTANQVIGMHIKGHTADPLLFPSKEAISMYEGFPPDLFVKAVSANIQLLNHDNELLARTEFSLKPHEEKIIRLIIGYSFETEFSNIEQISKELAVPAGSTSFQKDNIPASAFAADWLKALPQFNNETDLQLKNELTWHAYVLEAMATYSAYYKETKIPQGTVYDFDWGIHASARDNFQHALPLVYYNPQLAKSVLKYMLKRTTAWGEIRLIEEGNGYAFNSSYFTSDQQLFFFLLLSEYLRVTKDYDFLKEKIPYYPVAGQSTATVLEFVQHCFDFLRDEIGTGQHGLVRLMNSDWNDAVFYIINAPYNRVVYTGESHMNSAMAISIFQNLLPQLSAAASLKTFDSIKPQLEMLSQGIAHYRSSVLDAFMKDMGNRTFPRRMYFNGKTYGENNMFLEPQGYTLLINELSTERKELLYSEMKKRVYAGEILGAREQQTPEFEDNEFDKGSRENGGFWWALNGPVILGVSQFDKAEAMRLLKNMSFANFSKAFPGYWTSYWSAADNVESSLIPEEGLPDQTGSYADEPVFCAHPHAWILYCYFKITR
jgi:cellobiose phosphorylase